MRLIARLAIMPMMMSEINASIIIRSFARFERGRVSAGENPVLVKNEKKR
jgi:hypothetical protein